MTDDDSTYISLNTTPAANPYKAIEATSKMTPITIAGDNVPEVVVYSTTYASYPRILAAGAIVNVNGNNGKGSQIRCSTEVSDDAEVLIYIDVYKCLAESKLGWFQGDNNQVVASADVPKAFWKKVVGRKFDVGLLLEDGEVLKEVPVSLRSKKAGTKTKAKSGKGRVGRERGSKDLSDVSGEDEAEA